MKKDELFSPNERLSYNERLERIDELEQENQRLREALEEIRMTVYPPDKERINYETLMEVLEIINKLLEKE